MSEFVRTFPSGHRYLAEAIGNVFNAEEDVVLVQPEGPAVSSVIELMQSRPEQLGLVLSQFDRLVAGYNGSWIPYTDYQDKYMFNYPIAQRHGAEVGMSELPYVSTLLPADDIKTYDEKSKRFNLTGKVIQENARQELTQAVGSILLSQADVQLIMVDGSSLLRTGSFDETRLSNRDTSDRLDDLLVSSVFQLYFQLIKNKHPIDADIVRNGLIETMPLMLERSQILYAASVGRNRLNYLDMAKFAPDFVDMIDNDKSITY